MRLSAAAPREGEQKRSPQTPDAPVGGAVRAVSVTTLDQVVPISPDAIVDQKCELVFSVRVEPS